MSYPIHYVPAGDVLPVFFDTYDGGTGASVTMTGLAVTDIEIYKDGGTTQRASDAGYTLLDTDGIDFDGITGIHGFSIDTGDNTDAGFYTVGAWFHVVVSAVTVDAQTVNFVACAFRLMSAETSAGVPQARASAVADGAISATTLASDTIAAAKIASGAITSAKFAAGAIDAAAIANGAIDAATFAAGAIDAAALAADAGTEIGTAVWATTTRLLTAGTNIDGSTFTAIPWNAAWDAEVQSEVDDALAARFTFTVAGFVDANMQYINDVVLTGDGSGTPFTVA